VPALTPATVRLARALLLTTAALLVLDAIFTAIVVGPIHLRLAEMYAPPPGQLGDDPPPSLWPFVGTSLPSGVTLAFVYVLTAAGITHGWPWLRIALPIAAPLVSACSATGTALFLWSPRDGDLTDARILAAKDVIPLWIQIAWAITAGLYVLLPTAAGILVALPSAAAQFKRRHEAHRRNASATA
jgi:hypothetical protein